MAAAVLALIGNHVMVHYFSQFRDGKTLALALGAELEGILEVVKARDYVPQIEQHVTGLEALQRAGDQATAVHVLHIRAADDYFEVYRSNVGRIGLLGPLAAPAVGVYTRLKAILEDMRTLQEIQRGLLAQPDAGIDPQLLIVFYRRILQFMKGTMKQAEELVPKLKTFAGRRLFWVLP